MRTIIHILSFILLFISFKSFSDEKTETSYIPTAYCNKSLGENPRFSPNGVDVIFVNGISNSPTDAVNSMVTLKRKVIDSLVPSTSEKIQVMNIYNPTSGLMIDSQELRDQAQAEEEAAEFTRDYIKDIQSKRQNLGAATIARLEKVIFSEHLRYIVTRDFLHSKKWYEIKQDGSIQDVNGSTDSENIGPTILKIVSAIEERILSGRRVIVVAHSQGNFFVEAAYSILKNKLSQEQLSGLQFVGVAVVSATTPNNKWITVSQDHTVYWGQGENAFTSGNIYAYPLGTYNSPKGNFDAVSYYPSKEENPQPSSLNIYKWDLLAHNFIKIYLNENIVLDNDHSVSTLNYMRELVKSALLDTTASTPVISLSPISATLSWINTGNSDMDLHVIEWLDGNVQHVYYSNKMGVLGYLDLDDTNGPGPEHYYYNVDNSSSNICASLYGKRLSFYVHPYAFNAEHTDEPVALNLKIGSSIYSKSILLNQSDRSLQSPDGILSGPHFFDVSFDYSGNYTVTTY